MTLHIGEMSGFCGDLLRALRIGQRQAMPANVCLGNGGARAAKLSHRSLPSDILISAFRRSI
jgi:hypothetical protein